MLDDGPLHHLIRMLGGLPGLGNRSARRIALHLLARRHTVMIPLADALKQAASDIRDCGVCGNLDMQDPCAICTDARRDRSKICVVAQVGDVWAIERTGAYKGLYHVLGGLLSALDGVGPDHLRLRSLEARAREDQVEEIILALSATVDGQTTAHLVTDRIKTPDKRITRLSHGVPVGGELDYLDDGTITTALKARRAD